MSTRIRAQAAVPAAPQGQHPPQRQAGAVAAGGPLSGRSGGSGRQEGDTDGGGGSPVAGAQRSERKPQTLDRLRRLLPELAKIEPPAGPEQAREEIVLALERARLPGWALPGLQDPETTHLRDGSYRIQLISHHILLNPWGAFRIVDQLWPKQPYFERGGRGGRGFRRPPAEDDDAAAGR